MGDKGLKKVSYLLRYILQVLIMEWCLLIWRDERHRETTGPWETELNVLS